MNKHMQIVKMTDRYTATSDKLRAVDKRKKGKDTNTSTHRNRHRQRQRQTGDKNPPTEYSCLQYRL